MGEQVGQLGASPNGKNGSAAQRPPTGRQRGSRIVFFGGGCIVLATFLPWVAARYELGPWYPNGMALQYAHEPNFTIGFIPLAAGVLAMTTARELRSARLGLGIGVAMSLFLDFVYVAFHGYFGQWMRSFDGFISASLGPGYWLMAAGTVVVSVGGVATVIGGREKPRLKIRRYAIDTRSWEPKPLTNGGTRTEPSTVRSAQADMDDRASSTLS